MDTEIPTQSEPAIRVAHLTTCYLDMADSSTGFSDDTQKYLRHGGELRQILSEIVALCGPSEQDTLVDKTRSEYMGAVLTRPRLTRRGWRAQKIDKTEEPYIDAVVAKVAAIIDASTPEEWLAVRQMPTLVEHASFSEDKPESKERLAANHLYVLLDTALKEHVSRREVIDDHRTRGPVVRVLGNRVVRLIIAGGILAATVSPKVGMIPVGDEAITEDVELCLKILSGSILGLDAPEVIRMQYLAIRNDRRSRALKEDLAGEQQLSDLAMRMAYSSTRYGGSTEHKIVTARSGTPDKHENLRRFDAMDGQFKELSNDPGGKPYSADQALGYAARLLIERPEQLAELTDATKSPAERRNLFLELTRDILMEDITRMKKGLSVSKLRKRVMRVLAVVPALLYPGGTSLASEATALGRDTAKQLKPGQRKD